jgi:hypothetical protein
MLSIKSKNLANIWNNIEQLQINSHLCKAKLVMLCRYNLKKK